MPERVRVRTFLAGRGDLALEDQFFTQLRIPNGVFKMTHRDRFAATIASTIALLAGRPGRVLDLACSSGIATVELAEALAAAGDPREVHGTDLAISASLVERGPYGVMLDSRGRVLQVDHPHWAMPRRPAKRDLLHPVRVAGAVAIRVYVAARPERTTPFQLVSSRVPGSGVVITEEDAAAPVVPGTFALVRVANLFNLSYFAPHALRRLVAVTGARVAPGGVLFIVRTHADGRHHGTFFERRGDRFVELERIGTGSEVSAFVP